jgi:hypothetical protein
MQDFFKFLEWLFLEFLSNRFYTPTRNMENLQMYQFLYFEGLFFMCEQVFSFTKTLSLDNS